jgi:hypothetical protein
MFNNSIYYKIIFYIIKKCSGYGLYEGLSKHTASAVTLPKIPPGIETFLDTTGVAFYPFPVDNG